MDAWQIERQVAYLLRAVAWADAPSAPVLTGGARVSDDGLGNWLPGSFLADGPVDLPLPFALVTVPAAEHDDELPGRLASLRVRATVVAGGGGVAGATGSTTTHDSHGERTTVGGTRDPVQGQGKSLGRGLDEVVGRLEEALGLTGRAAQLTDSVHALAAELVGRGAVLEVDGSQVLARELDIRVRNATVARRYHDARRLLATGGVGSIVFSWSAGPDRFDRLEHVLRRSGPGGPAPATPTAGTGVALGTPLATAAVAGGLAPGTYAVTLFVGYDEVGAPPTTSDRYSLGIAFTGIVVT